MHAVQLQQATLSGAGPHKEQCSQSLQAQILAKREPVPTPQNSTVHQRLATRSLSAGIDRSARELCTEPTRQQTSLRRGI